MFYTLYKTFYQGFYNETNGIFEIYKVNLVNNILFLKLYEQNIFSNFM